MNHHHFQRYQKRGGGSRSCSNCGDSFHHYRDCPHPITSYGVIAFRVIQQGNHEYRKDIQDILMSLSEIVIDKDTHCVNGVKYILQYFLIQRKNSIGCTDLFRGKFRTEDKQQLSVLFDDLTPQERTKIRHLHSNYQQPPQQDKKKTRMKLRRLNVHKWLNNHPPKYKYPEWGFPKGRKSKSDESDRETAIREFLEETNFQPDDFEILDTIRPFQEVYPASNHVAYCHKYYLAQTKNALPTPTIDPDKPEQSTEVGDLCWFGYADAMKIIRSDRTAKKKVLTEVHRFLTSLLQSKKINVEY